MNFDIRDIVIFILGLLLSVLVLVAFSSCKTSRQSKTDYTYTGSDYTHTEHIRDSCYIDRIVEVHDSSRAEQETSVEHSVNFVPGGGSYNMLTGQMEGVQSLSVSERERLLQNEVNSLRAQGSEQRARIEALSDSLKRENAILQESVETETKAQSFWWIWLITGFSIGVGGIIALKKIPYTKPFMVWL